MRIAYGVHGYGRGHATRALSVLQSLAPRHEVLIFAGGDARETLSESFDVEPTPCLDFAYRNGKRSDLATFRRNLPWILDLVRSRGSVQRVTRRMEQFQPDVVISDAEPWTSAAGHALGVPRIGFDHFGILVHCKVALPVGDWVRSWLDRNVYSLMMRWPERVLVSSFFRAAPSRSGVSVVGPLLSERVRALRPTQGRHLLCYFNKGGDQVSPRVLGVLNGLGQEVRLYGAGREGVSGNVVFRRPGRGAFLRDLASCRAVVSTAGNQLMGEAMALAKPVLAIPETTVEQRLNARELVRLGIGESVELGRLSVGRLQSFLSRADDYARAAYRQKVDGRTEAVQLLERWIEELAVVRRPGGRDAAFRQVAA